MDNTLIFNTRDTLTRIALDKVMYFESDANYTHVIFANGTKVTLLVSLTRLENLIGDVLLERKSVFVRIGKKYIVNSAFIFQIDILGQRLLLSDLTHFYQQRQKGDIIYPIGVVGLKVSKEALKKLRALFILPHREEQRPQPMAVPLGDAIPAPESNAAR